MMDEVWAREIARWLTGVRDRGGASRWCVGMAPVGRAASAWTRCGRRALAGEILCARHRDALNGVVLGILQREQAAAEKKARSRRGLPCAGHTRRRGGKTDVPRETRTGPGVSVSCSQTEAVAAEVSSTTA